MKRIFALALVLCMALGMMVMTVSAAPRPLCTHNNLPHNCTRHAAHVYVREMNGPFDVSTCTSEPGSADFHDWYDDFEECFGIAPYVGLLIGVNGVASFEVCTPVAQPKTGVMDTLPLWFGVMAVSACAYVLTSKKKIF